MSTQLKVRLISAAPSCVAVDFILIAPSNISERTTTNNLFHVTISRRRYRERGNGVWGLPACRQVSHGLFGLDFEEATQDSAECAGRWCGNIQSAAS
jgi:hypothetical protein